MTITDSLTPRVQKLLQETVNLTDTLATVYKGVMKKGISILQSTMKKSKNMLQSKKGKTTLHSKNKDDDNKKILK